MKNELPENIQELKSILCIHDIWLCRYYFDNTYTFCGTNPEWDDYMQSQGWHKDGVESLILPVMGMLTSEPQLIFWSSEGGHPQNTLHREIHLKTGAKAGHNYIIKRHDHVENIGFSTKNSINELQQSLFTQRVLHMEFLLLLQDYHRNLDLKHHDNLGVNWTTNTASRLANNSLPLTLLGKSIKVSLRQAEVLVHLCRGLSFKEAAKIMNISPRTIDFHVSQVRDMLGNNPLNLILKEIHLLGDYDIFRGMVG